MEGPAVMIEFRLQDIGFALRTLAKNPGFTAVAVLMLAVGIGINTTVFTVTNAMLFNGYPRLDPNGRILCISRLNKNTGRGAGMFYLGYEYWRAHAKSFPDMAIVTNGALRIRLTERAADLPDNYDVTELSTNAFRVVNQSPILGRDFDSSDEAAGAPAVAILNYLVWATRYSKNPAIIGQTIRINEIPTTVIGVMGPDIEFPYHRVDLWILLIPTRAPMGAAIGTTSEIFQNRRLRFAGASVFGRLANGVTVENARVEMAAIGSQLSFAYPDTNRDLVPLVRTFTQAFIGARRQFDLQCNVGCGRLFALDRVCQARKSHDGSRDRPNPGNLHTQRARRRPRAVSFANSRSRA
jgi:hypothetical protein